MPKAVNAVKNAVQALKTTLLLTCYLGTALLVGDLGSAKAQEVSFSPAFKTIGFWDAERNMRVDVNVWYPTHSRPSSASYGPWKINVVRYGKAVEGRFPLIVLSHDSAASRFSYHESAALLSSVGFVVMAPDHAQDNLQRMTYNFQWQQLSQRMQEIRAVLHMATTHEDVRSMVDGNRIGIMGFGTGATTALLMGGAMLDATGWDNYCMQVPLSTAYCNAWAQGHVEKMLTTLPPFGQSFVDARIKAMVAVSPKYDFLLTHKALQLITRPLLVLEAEKDLSKKVWDDSSAQAIFPPQTLFAPIDGVDARDLMSACSPELRKDLPDLCGSSSPEEREKAHEVLNTQMIHFFLEHLGQRTY